jgi:hypothetical protein
MIILPGDYALIYNTGNALGSAITTLAVVGAQYSLLYFMNTVNNAISDAAAASTAPYIQGGPLSTFTLRFNGNNRFAPQNGKYFNQYQPYQYHSGCPPPGVYVYSFALHPEKHQPSGSCNFSRIDNITAVYTTKACPGATNGLMWKCFAVSYNILRISSGMAGLAFV